VDAGARAAPTPPAAGQWHDLDVIFTPPRFDAEGKKLANARIERVLLNDVLLHEGLELAGPCLGAPLAALPEAPTGPLIISGTRGACALRQVRVRPVQAVDDAGLPLFNGQTSAAGASQPRTPMPLPSGKTSPRRTTPPRPPAGPSRTACSSAAAQPATCSRRAGTSRTRGPRQPAHLARVTRSTSARPSPLAGPTATRPGQQQLADPQKTAVALAPVNDLARGPGTWFDYRVRCGRGGARTSPSR
jgi:hypothetical protein